MTLFAGWLVFCNLLDFKKEVIWFPTEMNLLQKKNNEKHIFPVFLSRREDFQLEINFRHKISKIVI